MVQTSTGIIRRLRKRPAALFVAAAALSLSHITELAYAGPTPARSAFESDLPDQLMNNLATSAAEYRAAGAGGVVDFTVETHVGPVPLKLKPFDIRGKNYRSLVTTEAGLVNDPVKVDLFEATADPAHGVDFARVALISNSNTKERKVEGFLRSGGSYYQVSQIRPDIKSVLATRLSQIEISQLIQRCGVDHLETDLHVGEATFGELALPKAARASAFETGSITTYKELQMATEADFEYVSGLGSSTSANAEILTTLASVDAIYRAQLGVTIVVTFQHAWATPDSFSTDVIDALEDFGNYWELNFRDGVTYDLAHLFSGRSYGSTLGVAWVGGVCSQIYEYGLSATLNGYRAYDVVVAAHEIGHNMGANHDLSGSCENLYIMCPTAGATSQFSPTSISAIDSVVQSVSCLATTTGEDPSDPDPDPRSGEPSLSVSISKNKVRYTVENTENCSEVQIVAAKSRSALENRTTFSLLGSMPGSAATQTARSTRVHRYKNGNASGKVYFDLTCDGTPQNTIQSIKASKIDSSSKTKSLNNVLRDLQNRFED